MQYEAQESEASIDNDKMQIEEPDFEKKYIALDYPIRQGESLEDIARKFDVNPFWVRWWNNGVLDVDNSKLRELRLYLPANDACAYIAELIILSEKQPILPLNDFRTLESNAPVNIQAVHSISPYLMKDEEEPMIIPRGMSYLEYKKAQ